MAERSGFAACAIAPGVGRTARTFRSDLWLGTTALLRQDGGTHPDVRLDDVSESIAAIGLMGPETKAIARAVGANELLELGYFAAGQTEIESVPVLAVRLSYVGEAGWKLSCAAADVLRVYRALYAAGAGPAGLFAQASMRIEKRFLAYGHDIDTDISPLQAGLQFAVAWDANFIGKDALLQQRRAGEQKRIVALFFDGDERVVPLVPRFTSFCGISEARSGQMQGA